MSKPKASASDGHDAIEWEKKWYLMPQEKLWRVAALSVGREPDNVMMHSGLNFEFDPAGPFQYPKDFSDRLEIAEANLGDALPAVRMVEKAGRWYDSVVRFDVFAGFAMKKDLPLAPGFPPPSDVPRTRGAGPRKGLDTRKAHTYLAMIAALAQKEYGADWAKSHKALAELVAKTTLRRIDVRTVKDALEAARQVADDRGED